MAPNEQSTAPDKTPSVTVQSILEQATAAASGGGTKYVFRFLVNQRWKLKVASLT